MMFANNRSEAGEVYSELMDDELINKDKIYIRKFIPLNQYTIGLGGIPIVEEYRFFICDGQILSNFYYWQNYIDDLTVVPNVNSVPKQFIQQVIDRIGSNCRAYVIDVAQTQEGAWIVIELNSFEHSGCAKSEFINLYSNLWKILNK